MKLVAGFRRGISHGSIQQLPHPVMDGPIGIKTRVSPHETREGPVHETSDGPSEQKPCVPCTVCFIENRIGIDPQWSFAHFVQAQA